jgi:hypothetical protein
MVSGVRSEPAEVWLVNGRPARFVWRERLFTVLSILERPAVEADEAHQRGRPDHEVPQDDGAGHDDEAIRQEGDVARDADGDTWRCWRVTAAAGRNVPPSIYRLCQDTATGRWLLSRTSR